jgi:hypothetical protein
MIKRFLRACVLAAVVAAILGAGTPTPLLATSTESCAEAYATALAEWDQFYDTCYASNSAVVVALLCVPVYAIGVYDAGQAYYGCVGAPLIIGG